MSNDSLKNKLVRPHDQKHSRSVQNLGSMPPDPLECYGLMLTAKLHGDHS